MNNDKCESKIEKALTYEEKSIIEYLQENSPEVLKNIRREGYSDKQIAQYALDQIANEKK